MGNRHGRGARSFTSANEDKTFFPDAHLTKGDLIDYYERIAEVMLPHLRGRAVAMRRYPNGILGKGFFQKDVPGHFPDWIDTVAVRKEGGELRQLTAENTVTLAYLANQGCIEIHVWPSRIDKPRHPDRMIFDLDPSGDDFGAVRTAAREAREVLEGVGLSAFVMTTGSRGLHVVAPLDRRAEFGEVRDFASRVARLLVARAPERLTVEQRKGKRRGRVFVDVMRNAYAQHAVAPYSVRARGGAPVAMPLDWDELADAKLHPQRYTIGNAFRRLSHKDDAWKSLARGARSLHQARRALDDLLEEEAVA